MTPDELFTMLTDDREKVECSCENCHCWSFVHPHSYAGVGLKQHVPWVDAATAYEFMNARAGKSYSLRMASPGSLLPDVTVRMSDVSRIRSMYIPVMLLAQTTYSRYFVNCQMTTLPDFVPFTFDEIMCLMKIVINVGVFKEIRKRVYVTPDERRLWLQMEKHLLVEFVDLVDSFLVDAVLCIPEKMISRPIIRSGYRAPFNIIQQVWYDVDDDDRYDDHFEYDSDDDIPSLIDDVYYDYEAGHSIIPFYEQYELYFTANNKCNRINCKKVLKIIVQTFWQSYYIRLTFHGHHDGLLRYVGD